VVLYTGAKGALENFTKVAAIEFGRPRDHRERRVAGRDRHRDAAGG
jgi:hypothetical protein